MKLVLLVLTFLTLNQTALATPRHPVSKFCQQELDTIPVQAGGRVKPFYVLAKESVKFLTHEKKPFGMTPSIFFCQLTLQGTLGLETKLDLPLKVEHMDAKKFLGLDENAKSIPASEMIDRMSDLRIEYNSIRENNAYKKELNKLLLRIQIYQGISMGTTWTIPDEWDEEKAQFNWIPISELLSSKDLGEDWNARIPATVESIKNLKEKYIQKKSDGFILEYQYFKWHLFSWAMLIVLLAIFTVVLMKKLTVTYTLASIALVLQTVSMIMRVFISGRAPITNMYETVMFSGFGALVLAFALTIYKKDRAFLLGGLCYNLLCLLMMTFANGMLNPSISPLVPVLRDNFWLSTHVTTIILSYAALALSWIIANITMIKEMTGKMTAQELKKNEQTIYSCLKYGVVLLAAGIILGGVWADYSWGRFWGWDPKETWSLIVLLLYMAILHGRYTSWISRERFIPFVALAFLSVMMAWFGVNYILASGLHSYGFSEGGAIFLFSFFAVQMAVFLLHFFRKMQMKTN